MIRYQHVRFYKIKIGEDFFYGKFRYRKTRYFLGRAWLDGSGVVVMPWRKIRSTRPFGKIRPPQPPEERDMQFVTVGGDRRSETIGGNEKCPAS